MNWIWLKLDRKLKTEPKYFVLQTLLAFVTLSVALVLLGIMGRKALVAALGSSLFIAFLTPNSTTAKARNMIGSHLLSGGVGLGFFHLINQLPNTQVLLILLSSLAVAVSMFIMVITDTEHPPAAGTALGLATGGGWVSFFFIVISVVVLFVIKKLLDPWLADLV
ncbi:MAG: HPP family protein [Candidatus Bipolaricaulia bacterium]